MRLILSLAVRSLRNRLLTTVLTLVSISLSIALLVGVENVRVGMRESFSNTIRGTDLIVGPRGGSLQVLLYSVFGMGAPFGVNLSPSTYEYWSNHPAVAWTVPYSLGDSHRGFRVVGTTSDFYERYRFRVDGRVEFAEGHAPATDHDVAIGSEVADRLGYQIGDRVAVTHGLRGGGIMDHDEAPFTVVGLLRRTFTPIDRSLYVTLEGVHAMHEGWEGGAPPGVLSGMPGATPPAMPGATPPAMPGATPPAMPGASPPPMPGASPPTGVATGAQRPISAEQDSTEKGTQITAFFVGLKSRPDLLRLQREINTWEVEPLTAIVPGMALAELWRTIGFAEVGLRVISFFVVAVGLLGMLVSLYSSLNARRREMAILRSVGAGPRKIVALLVLESGMLSVMGSAAGMAFVYIALFIAQPIIEANLGLHIPIKPPGNVEYLYIGIVCVAGFLVGFVPALKAYRNTLTDGLSVRL